MPQKTVVRMFAKIADSKLFLGNRVKRVFLVLAMKAMLIIFTQDHLAVMAIQFTDKIFARHATESSPIRCQ